MKYSTMNNGKGGKIRSHFCTPKNPTMSKPNPRKE